MQPLISVITPCFNHGQYLDEACNSVPSVLHPGLFEHIIVNDGSTDPFTIEKLAELESRGYHIIHQENAGLANARNRAIAASKGKYILPLDSDNKIESAVMHKAASIMDSNEEIDVVFTDAYLFGQEVGNSITTDFDLYKLLFNNYIDACALIRKATLEKLGGYDPSMPYMGHEDWDFWITLAKNNGRFHYLKEFGYHYRVVQGSMLRTVTKNKQAENRRYIFEKHASWISDVYTDFYESCGKLWEMNKYVNLHRFKSGIKMLMGVPLMK